MQTYYLDYNATTPVAPEVLNAMEPFFTRYYGNASSLHHMGQDVAKAIRQARRDVAALLGITDETEIVFTSGGTESNNMAIRSALQMVPDRKEIIISAVEHSSVNKLCKQLKNEGYFVHRLSVNNSGQIDLQELRESITNRTAIVSIMTANNETGVLFPVEKIAATVRERNVFFHVDAVQSVAKSPLHLKNSMIDFLSLSAHKFYGPKGIGCLYVRKEIPVKPLIFGGAQERGRRAGTENVPGIIGLGVASKIALMEMDDESIRIGKVRDFFEAEVTKRIRDVRVNGDSSNRLSNTSNLRFEGVDGEALLFAMDQHGICASSGSACMSGAREPSHVLKAMGLSDEAANSSIRFSFGRYSKVNEIEDVIKILQEIVGNLRTMSYQDQHPHTF